MPVIYLPLTYLPLGNSPESCPQPHHSAAYMSGRMMMSIMCSTFWARNKVVVLRPAWCMMGGGGDWVLLAMMPVTREGGEAGLCSGGLVAGAGGG